MDCSLFRVTPHAMLFSPKGLEVRSLAVKHGFACATPGWRAQWIPHAIGVQVWGIPPA
jgi:hypothetical protein